MIKISPYNMKDIAEGSSFEARKGQRHVPHLRVFVNIVIFSHNICDIVTWKISAVKKIED